MVQRSTPRVQLIREYKDDMQGTPGRIIFPGGRLFTLELPWLDNRRKLSCIPEGTYRCVARKSPRFGLVYWVTDVPNRDLILLHSGNWAGAIPTFKTHVQGCILLGMKRGVLGGQRAVLVSRPAVRGFYSAMGGFPFMLEVSGANGNSSSS